MKTSPRLGVCSILCVLVTIAVSTACRSVRREAELARAKQEYLDSVRLGAKPQVPAVDPREAPPAIRGRARFVQSGRSEVDVIVPTITKDGIVDEVEGWRAALEIGQLPPATGLAQPMTFRLGYSGYEASKESVDYDLEKHDRIWTAVHVTYYDGTDRWYQRSWFLENQLGDRFVELKLANDLGKPALRLVRDDLQVLEPNTPAVYQRPNTNVGDPNSDSVAIRGRARFRSKTSNRSATGTLEGVAPVQQKPVTSASAVLYFSESTGRVPEPRNRTGWVPLVGPDESGLYQGSVTGVLQFPATDATMVWVAVRFFYGDGTSSYYVVPWSHPTPVDGAAAEQYDSAWMSLMDG
ncbi:MAG: hypothetical protein U1F29_02690 [Planctomycetota bacterium]